MRNVIGISCDYLRTNYCPRHIRRQTRHSCHRKLSQISYLSEHTKCVHSKYKYLQHTVTRVSYAKFYRIFVKMWANILKKILWIRVKRSLFSQSCLKQRLTPRILLMKLVSVDHFLNFFFPTNDLQSYIL